MAKHATFDTQFFKVSMLRCNDQKYLFQHVQHSSRNICFFTYSMCSSVNYPYLPHERDFSKTPHPSGNPNKLLIKLILRVFGLWDPSHAPQESLLSVEGVWTFPWTTQCKKLVLQFIYHVPTSPISHLPCTHTSHDVLCPKHASLHIIIDCTTVKTCLNYCILHLLSFIKPDFKYVSKPDINISFYNLHLQRYHQYSRPFNRKQWQLKCSLQFLRSHGGQDICGNWCIEIKCCQWLGAARPCIFNQSLLA